MPARYLIDIVRISLLVNIAVLVPALRGLHSNAPDMSAVFRPDPRPDVC